MNKLSQDLYLFLSKSDWCSTKIISLQPFNKNLDLVFSFWEALEVSITSFPFYRKKLVFMNSLRKDFISKSSSKKWDVKVQSLKIIIILQKWLQQSTTLAWNSKKEQCILDTKEILERLTTKILTTLASSNSLLSANHQHKYHICS